MTTFSNNINKNNDNNNVAVRIELIDVLNSLLNFRPITPIT